MRILILSNLYPNPWQPQRAAFNRQQFAALAREHQVRIIAPVGWTDQWSSKHRGPHDRIMIRDGLTVEYPTYLFPPKVLRSWHGHCYLRSVRTAFERAVQQFHPDVLLATWAYPDVWAGVQLAREAHLPIVAKVHGSDVLLLNQYRSRFAPTVEALRNTDAVVTISRQLAGSVEALGVASNRIHVVYNGVDTSLFHPIATDAARARLNLDDDPLLLFIGNLVTVKGLDVLIQACTLLHRRGMKFQCYLIGQGPLHQALSQQINAAGLADRVKLIGPRPLEQLREWYCAASVIVLPSRSEGVPNVILEALSCGTRVVASRVGGIPEILDDCSMVPPDDAPALANAIERTTNNPATATRISQTHDWRTSAAQLADILGKVIKHRKQEAA